MHQDLVGTVGIGLQPILLDVPDDPDGQVGCKKVFNLDTTGEAYGHGGYWDGCLKFFHNIPWAY